MAELHVRAFAGALLRKGFERVEGKHHAMFFLVAEGKRTSVRTRLSHGQRRVDEWLLSEIAKELHLSKRELLRFVECAMSGQEYAALMAERGYLSR
jgi:hypothetical protein